MLRLGVLGRRVDEHLELVELVHADDAAGVLAVGAGLAAVAGRPAGIALRAGCHVDDLAHVVAGEGHLARADEVEVVGFELVDLVGVLAEETRAAHHLGAHERRRDHRDEPGVDGALQRERHERVLEARADAGEEVEARARHLGAALHVDRAELLAEGEVVERLEVERRRLAVGAEGDEVLFAAGGHPLDDDVLDAGERLVGGGLGLGDGLLRLLDAVAQVFGLRDEGGLVFLGCLGDGLAVRVLLGAQLLERGDRRAAGAVCGERVVDRVGRLAPRLLRALDEVGVVAKQCQIDHPSSLVRRVRPVGPARDRSAGARDRRRWAGVHEP